MANLAGFDAGDWIAVVASALLSGIGGAMAWFNSAKKDLNKRLRLLEESMGEYATTLAVLKTCQENSRDRLDEISAVTKHTDQSLKDLSQAVTQVVLMLQAKKD